MADVKSIINNAAGVYGLDASYLTAMGRIESGLDPNAQNKATSAGGLFQFVDGTWYGKNGKGGYGNGKSKYDPEANTDAMARFTRDNASILKRKLGRDPTPGELYLAHQQGAGGASDLLANPDALAKDIVGRAAVIGNEGTETMTAREFANKWISRMDQELAQGDGTGTGLVTPSPSLGNVANSTFNSDDNNPTLPQGEAMSPAALNTPEDQRKAERDKEENSYSLLSGAGHAVWNNWTVVTPFRTLGYQDPDPNFRLTDENLKVYGEGIPDQYLDEFSDAVSDQHAQAIRSRLLDQMEVNQKLNNMGWTGTALQFAAAATDPGMIAATAAIGAATGGLGIAPAVAARFGRVGMVALGAAEGVAGNLASDSALSAVDPTITMADQWKFSAGMGAIFGGAFGALRKNPHFAEEADMIYRAGTKMREEALDNVQANTMKGSLSAAGADLDKTRKFTGTDQELIAISKDLDKMHEAVFLDARVDLSAQLSKSTNPLVRAMSPLLVEDAVRSKNRGAETMVTQLAASETQSRLHRAALDQFMTGYDKAWKAYRKANKIPLWKAGEAREKFGKDMVAYMRSNDPSVRMAFPKEVQQGAQAFRATMDGWAARLKEAGIEFNEVFTRDYVPRVLNMKKVNEHFNDFGNQGIEDLYHGAIRSAQPNIDDALARKMAKAFTDRGNKASAGMETNVNVRGADDLEELRNILATHLDDKEIDDVISNFSHETSADNAKIGASHLKHRVLLDENFSGIMHDKYGVRREVKLSDLYMDDPVLLMNMYSRQMSGNMALAGVKVADPKTGEMLLDGIRTRADWDKFKEKIKIVGADTGADNATDEKHLDWTYEMIRGIPQEYNQTSMAAFSRTVRDFNFARLMGSVGFNQIQEIGRAAGQTGWKAMLQAVPALRFAMKEMKEGRGSEIAEELMNMGNGGVDHVRSKYYLKADDYGSPLTAGSGPMGRMEDTIAPALHAMTKFTATYSGFNAINSIFQRAAGHAMAIKFTNAAKFGGKLDFLRTRALGLSDETVEKVLENIRQHASFRGDGTRGSQLTGLGMEKWDLKTRNDFEGAMYRAMRNMILENDLGQTNRWLNSPGMKIVTQFRTFTIGAWTKATLQGLNMRDTDAALGFLATAFIGAATYSARMALANIGRDDYQEVMAERLSLKKLGLAAFYNTSEASLLPTAVDTLSGFGGAGPVFDFRASGLSTGIIGNPTFDLLDSTQKAMGGLVSAAVGDDYSRQDYQALARTLPFNRVMFFTWFHNMIASSRPSERYDDGERRSP